MLPPRVRGLLDRFFAAEGGLEPTMRRACAGRASLDAGGAHALSPAGDPPEALQAWVDKVASAASTCDDEDVARLRAAGFDEPAIYDATVAAALGAATARLERALELLRGARR
jgi:alkylhydroperoxidase family enzyme